VEEFASSWETGAESVDAKVSSKDDDPCASTAGAPLLTEGVNILSKPLVWSVVDSAASVFPLTSIGGAGGNLANVKSKLSSNVVSKVSWGALDIGPLGIFPIASSKAVTPATVDTVALGSDEVVKELEVCGTGAPKASFEDCLTGWFKLRSCEGCDVVKAGMSINRSKA
jgi:hypothetical protein